MSRGVALDPAVTRSGTDKIVNPPPLKTLMVAFDPVVSQSSGTVTVVPDLPGG